MVISRGQTIGIALFILTVFSLASAMRAAADPPDGNALLANCQEGDNPNAHESTTKKGMCIGYITGVADALVPAGLYCVQSGATAGDVVDVVKLYIQNHPEKRYMTAPKTVVDALVERYPCN